MSTAINYTTSSADCNPQIDDSQLADSRAWVARAQVAFPKLGITVTVSDLRVTLIAHCAKCHAPVTEAFDMDADAGRTKYALTVYRDKLSRLTVPLLCYGCRRLSLTVLPRPIQERDAPGGGGRKRKTKPSQAKPKASQSQRRMTFSMAVQIASGYGYLLVRYGHRYAVQPRTGGEWTVYATLNAALAVMQTATARKAR